MYEQNYKLYLHKLNELPKIHFNSNEHIFNQCYNFYDCCIDTYLPHVFVNQMFYDQIVGLEQYVYWQNTVGEDVMCPCACGVGFVPYNHTNLDLARVPFLCHLCYFDVNSFVKITCIETDTQQSNSHINIACCHIQMLNWIVPGPQGLVPIVYLIDHSSAINNSFYFLYKINQAIARIIECHTCPELPLSVIKVYENITVQ